MGVKSYLRVCCVSFKSSWNILHTDKRTKSIILWCEVVEDKKLLRHNHNGLTTEWTPGADGDALLNDINCNTIVLICNVISRYRFSENQIHVRLQPTQKYQAIVPNLVAPDRCDYLELLTDSNQPPLTETLQKRRLVIEDIYRAVYHHDTPSDWKRPPVRPRQTLPPGR